MTNPDATTDATGPTTTAAAARLAELGEEYFVAEHTYDPYNATLLGIAEFDGLAGDPSRAASDRAAAALGAIADEAAALPEAELDATRQVDRDVLVALARGAAEDAHHALWAANVSAKGYVSRQGLVFQAVPTMTVADPDAADRYLSRLGGLGAMFRSLGERYAEERADGRVPTRMGVEHAIEQLDGYLGQPLEADALLDPVRGGHGTVAALFDRATSLLEQEVRPGMAALADRLRTTILPSARDDDHVGITEVPGGAEGYAAAVRRHTTTDLTPDEVHQIGLDELEILRDEAAAIGERLFGERDFAAIADRLRQDPALRFATSDEIMAVAHTALDRAESVRDRYFPEDDISVCVIEPINEIDAASSALGYYQPPAVDGSRPGTFFVNASAPATHYRYEYEALTFHESVPGHHMQLAMAQRLDIPRYRRHLDVEACSFNEGWGLYSEQFADDAGLYSDDLSRLGMLSMRAVRACRLVVDTGMHAKGWSRERAVQFMLANTATTEEHVRSEVDRYIAWPGQALAYMIGRREILRLRSGAQQALGDAFDIRAFHGAVLGNGAVPLTVLAGAVGRWQDDVLAAR
ncbi:DUF885 domain-containing protein [Curtobacterium sp. RRHDQ10]|uniref:DUF885 domain-containing protein n=1 Tax=Curtobacterium phyllosphaerae TaxID=3413379 RepID=UPI003BF0E815